MTVHPVVLFADLAVEQVFNLCCPSIPTLCGRIRRNQKVGHGEHTSEGDHDMSQSVYLVWWSVMMVSAGNDLSVDMVAARNIHHASRRVMGVIWDPHPRATEL